jgi:hypothetical protein
MMGNTISLMPMSPSSIPSAEGVRGTNPSYKQGLKLTSEPVSWSILGPVDVGCDGAREVADADLKGDSDGSLVLSGKVSTQPGRAFNL